jgi:hypothetical protein
MRIESTFPPREFPPLTKDALEQIYALFLDLENKFSDSIPGFEQYTGTDESIGTENSHYNSIITKFQFQYALAMTRHPLVIKVAKNDFDISEFDPKILVGSKIMAGMKILDLGSGPMPVFARVCRALGADVWTVDKEALYNSSLKKVLQEAEKARHIVLDLSSKNATQTILKRSSGNFNLVTAANLDSALFLGGKKVGWPLVKKGGVYYEVTASSYPELKE